MVDTGLMDALEAGDLEFRDETIKLTASGQQHVDKLMLLSTDALETIMLMALNDVVMTRGNKLKIYNVFQLAIEQCRHKDKILYQLMRPRQEESNE